jgi:hypothetical protein
MQSIHIMAYIAGIIINRDRNGNGKGSGDGDGIDT